MRFHLHRAAGIPFDPELHAVQSTMCQRGALSAPIRFTCDVLEKVKTGEFVPLAPRNEGFPEQPDQAAFFHNSNLATDDCIEQIHCLVMQQCVLFYIHAAPPCGTCSRAREGRVPARLKRQWVPDPKPLRSTLHPNSITGVDKECVRAVFQQSLQKPLCNLG